MDALDKRILRILQNDGRISNQDLAEAAQSSSSAVWRRVKKLEEDGVITGYAAQVNADAAEFEFHAIAQVKLSRHDPLDQREFITMVKTRDEIMDCFMAAGDADFFLRILCKDKHAYNRLLDDFIFRLPGVSNVNTSLILKEVVHKSQLPF